MKPLPRAIPIITRNHIPKTNLIAETVNRFVRVDGFVVVEGVALFGGGAEGGVAAGGHLVVAGVGDVGDEVAVLVLEAH